MIPDTLEEAGVGRWRLDPARSTAEFRVPNFWGLVKVTGRFERFSGWLEVGEQGERRLELTIDATSINTGNDKRDEHLRSGDFFDTEHHPTVRFVSTSVSDPAGGRIHVQGELLAAGHAWCWSSSRRSGNMAIGWSSKPAPRSTSASSA